jgi:putative membrane protein insertion efficiency factor
MKWLLLALLRGYRFLLSPWLGNSCRFWPTCSMYAMEAIESHGAARGSWMMLTRLARCHPYSRGGVDPVPAQFRWRCWCPEHAPKDGSATLLSTARDASKSLS